MTALIIVLAVLVVGLLIVRVLKRLSGGQTRVLTGEWVRPSFTVPFVFKAGPWRAAAEQTVRLARFELEGSTSTTLEVSVAPPLARILAKDPDAARIINRGLAEPALPNGMRWAGTRLRTMIVPDAPLTCLYWVWQDGVDDELILSVKFHGPEAHEAAADAFVSSVLPELPEPAEMAAETREKLAVIFEAAKRGDATAQYEAGALLLDADPEGAHQHLRRSADQGHADAEALLGMCYAEGTFGDEDLPEAFRLLKRAVAQGHAGAQSVLGSLHADGRGVEKNVPEALRLWRSASERGDAGAQHMLAEHLATGEQIQKDEAEALRLFRLSAAQEFAPAQYALAELHASGSGGVSKDDAEAVRLFQLAAEQGHEDAIEALRERGLEVTG